LEAEGDKGVRSLERALDILEALSTEHDGLGITDLSKRVGLQKSTVHRLTQTLVRRGYVEKKDDGAYRLGLKMIEAVGCYINSLELQTQARPFVAQITAELGLTAHLGVLEGDQVVYIERMDVYSGVKLYSQIGLRMHAYCSSLGKCLLSALSGEELSKVMGGCKFERFTPNTISSFEELKQTLKQARSQGWAMDNLEFSPENRCVGAPIFDYRGEIIAAVSASGPPSVFTEDRVPQVAAFVKDKAMAISMSLGYTGKI
jgi:DNA-binding IclR family transcriptional regulator